jgi:hypothetical protein
MNASIKEINPYLKYRVARTVFVIVSSFRKIMGSERNAANNGNKEMFGFCINNRMAMIPRNHLFFIPDTSLKKENT